MARRMPSTVTALMVIGLCLFTSAGAISMVRLATLEMTLSAATPEKAAIFAPHLAALGDDPVVGARAQAMLLDLARGDDPSRDLREIGDLLALAPLASGAWRDLARARLEAGEPIAAVAKALAMAKVTGPNEAHEMAARASFALPLWPILPLKARNDLIQDLVGGWVEMRTSERAALRVTLSQAQPKTQAAIEAGLRRAGAAGVALIQALGLGGAVIIGR